MSENTHDYGFDLLFHPSTNKSTAFTLEERRRLDLREHILTQMYEPSYEGGACAP